MQKLLIFSVLALAPAAFADDWYVSENRADTLTIDGVSHAVTHTSIQDALDAANAGDTVWVRDGFVCDSGLRVANSGSHNRLDIAKSVTLRSVSGTREGAFTVVGAPDTTAPQDELGRGPNGIRCINVSAPNTVIIGCVLTNGFTKSNDAAGAYGGGIYLGAANCLVSNCLFTACAACAGGALSSGSPGNTLAQSIVTGCRARYGAATQRAGTNHASLDVVDCTITNNVGIEGGSIFYRSRLVRSRIVGNEAPGAVAAPSGTVDSEFCTFSDNTAASVIAGGGTHHNTLFCRNVTTGSCIGQQGNFHNCVILDNDSPKAVFYYSSAYNCTIYDTRVSRPQRLIQFAKLYNSIAWSAAGPSASDDVSGESPLSHHSCWRGATDQYEGATAEDSRLKIDGASLMPLIVSAASPCVDSAAAKDAATYDIDILGRPRLIGDGYDMGAFEFKPSGFHLILQ